MTSLELVGVAKRFNGQWILGGVDLEVAQGELVAILGASGSGKTTLLRLVAGFERADSGMIMLGGRMMAGPSLHVAPERRRIGYVAQEGALFPHLSVGANVLFGLPGPERQEMGRAEALLERVGLSGAYAQRDPRDLSGGEQQRVALARALAPGPSLVLLDEPFSALDAALRVDTRRAVAEALLQSGATALLVTHDQSEALSMGHRVAVLRSGRFVQVAEPEDLYRRPADPDLARFVGDAVMLPGTICSDVATCALGDLSLAVPHANGPALVMIRPEQIALGPAEGGGALQAVVCTVVFYGHDASVSLRLDDAGIEIAARVPGQMAPSCGQEVTLSVHGKVMAYVT